MKTILKSLAFAVTLSIASSCQKPAGPGGRAMVTGKVYVKDYDKYATIKLSEYYASGESVFICYGNNTAVGNDVKTSTDGTFQFLYLNKGHYKVFLNSRDTSIHFSGSNKTIPVIMEFDITNSRQIVDLGTVNINK